MTVIRRRPGRAPAAPTSLATAAAASQRVARLDPGAGETHGAERRRGNARFLNPMSSSLRSSAASTAARPCCCSPRVSQRQRQRRSAMSPRPRPRATRSSTRSTSTDARQPAAPSRRAATRHGNQQPARAMGTLASETNGDLVLDALTTSTRRSPLGDTEHDYYIVGFAPAGRAARSQRLPSCVSARDTAGRPGEHAHRLRRRTGADAGRSPPHHRSGAPCAVQPAERCAWSTRHTSASRITLDFRASR